LSSILTDDDDWGEMISTPPTTTASKFPVPEAINPTTTSPATFVPVPIEAVKETATGGIPEAVIASHSSAKISDDGVNVKGSRDSVTSSIDESLFKAFSSSTTFDKKMQGSKNILSTDDLDPWGSPSLGNSVENNSASFPDAFTTNNETASQPISGSADNEPDPWKTPSIPANKETTTFDAFDNKSITASNVIVQTPVVPTPQATSSSADSWSSADFSFFDTPAATTSAAKPKVSVHPVGKAKKSVGFSSVISQVKHTPSPLSQAINPKSSTIPLNKAISTPVRRHGQSKTEVEQDRIVAGIIKGLPDLSYMLRR